MPGPDEITAHCLDTAVEVFGGWIEGKLNQIDKSGKPIHKLNDLLLDQVGKKRIRADKAGAIMNMMGGQTISLEALMNDPTYIAQVESGLVKPPPGWENRQQKAV